MAAKSKPKVERNRFFGVLLIILVIFVISVYVWAKISQVLYKNNSWIDPGWFDYFPLLGDYFQPDQQKGTLSIFQRTFYTHLWSSIYDDIQFVSASVSSLAIYISEVISSVLALIAVVVLICVCLTVSLYKDTRGKSLRRQKDKKARKRNGLSTKNEHVCCEHQEDISVRNKLWWKWLTLIVFLAILLSIPWEFVRMYQSMVAEKVAQMQAGIPAECLPDQTVVQSMRSWIRWYLSWAEDPCLVYHKALIVDPMWQVPPLMVLSSAFSHCIMYPIEVLFGGLGRAFRMFFSEIPAPWQPLLLIVIVIFSLLTLIMAFGYRLHLPFLFKFEPKTPVYLRHRSHKDKDITKEKQNLQFAADESQQSIQSSQESQYSQETQDFD